MLKNKVNGTQRSRFRNKRSVWMKERLYRMGQGIRTCRRRDVIWYPNQHLGIKKSNLWKNLWTFYEHFEVFFFIHNHCCTRDLTSRTSRCGYGDDRKRGFRICLLGTLILPEIEFIYRQNGSCLGSIYRASSSKTNE